MINLEKLEEPFDYSNTRVPATIYSAVAMIRLVDNDSVFIILLKSLK